MKDVVMDKNLTKVVAFGFVGIAAKLISMWSKLPTEVKKGICVAIAKQYAEWAAQNYDTKRQEEDYKAQYEEYEEEQKKYGNGDRK